MRIVRPSHMALYDGQVRCIADLHQVDCGYETTVLLKALLSKLVSGRYRSLAIRLLCKDTELESLGLFDPGHVPKPTMETFTKDMESWEKTAESAEQWEKNHGGI